MMSCFSCTIPSHFMCIILSSLLHSEYSGLEMEVTGIVSILEAMEGIDNSLLCLCGHINSIYLRRRGRKVGSFFSGTVQCRSIENLW